MNSRSRVRLPRQQQEEIPPVLRRHDRVEIRIRARVQRVKEHQQYLGARHSDQGIPEQRGQGEERDRRPTREIREHEQRHLLRDRHLPPGAAPAGLVRQTEVDLGVAEDYQGEGQAVGEDHGEDVRLVHHSVHFHRQADATRN